MSTIDYQQFLEIITFINNLPLEESEVFLTAIAPLVSKITHTGIGSDACLAYRCLPLPVHYYSPVPDLADLDNRKIWTQRSMLPGINWNEQEQLSLLALLGKKFGPECHWPPHATGNSNQFFTENNSFSFGCAASTYCIIRHYKPKRVLEIGSGYSSLLINKALEANALELANSEYTIIDPYPPPFINEKLKSLSKLMGERVELTNTSIFLTLKANDILLVDSGHTVRTGGDVNFLILEVLPRLNSGVIIHFHDIPIPYEYPETYFKNPVFRMFWTESYLLQAFLCFNHHFKILLAMSFLMQEHLPEFSMAFCHFDPAIHHNHSGSFWIQKL